MFKVWAIGKMVARGSAVSLFKLLSQRERSSNSTLETQRRKLFLSEWGVNLRMRGEIFLDELLENK